MFILDSSCLNNISQSHSFTLFYLLIKGFPSAINVNNLIAETLHPDNFIYKTYKKLYNYDFSKKQMNKFILNLNKISDENNLFTYN